MKNLSDFELIKLFNQGDESAFKYLLSLYKKSIYKWSYYFIGNADLTEDIFQEVSMVLYSSLSKFRFKSQFPTYLYAIVKNISHNKLRVLIKERKNTITNYDTHSDIINQLPDNRTTSIEENERNSDVGIMNKAIVKIDSKFRECLLLFYIQEYSYKEIAKILSLKEGTVKSRISRAKEKLMSVITEMNSTDKLKI